MRYFGRMIHQFGTLLISTLTAHCAPLRVHDLVNFGLGLKTVPCNGESGGQGLLMGAVSILGPRLVPSPQGPVSATPTYLTTGGRASITPTMSPRMKEPIIKIIIISIGLPPSLSQSRVKFSSIVLLLFCRYWNC